MSKQVNNVNFDIPKAEAKQLKEICDRNASTATAWSRMKLLDMIRTEHAKLVTK